MLKQVCCASTVLLLCGCGGPSIWTLDRDATYPEQLDGALLSYALARGVVTFNAAYTKDGTITLNSDQKVNALPDFAHHHVLAYNHTGLSSDDITISFEGALLKKISSTTEDKTIDAVKAVNALLTQVSAAQAAFKENKKNATAATPMCADMKVTRLADVTNNLQEPLTIQQAAPGCTLDIQIKIGPPTQTMGVVGFPKGPMDPATEDRCDSAVCFRLGASFRVTAIAAAYQGKDKILETTPMEFVVLAPRADAIGFVRFNRRAFVANTTSVTFTNGIVSEFSAKNPSEVLGFLQLPTELLKGVVLTVPLVR